MMRRFVVPVLVLAAALGAGGHPGSTAAETADLELALAVDVSGSIDDEEAMLQRQGYIAAFRHPRVIDAIRRGRLGRIAVAYYEWAGFGHIEIIADWTLIHDRASAESFADRLSQAPPRRARRTAISDAIDFAVVYFEQSPFVGERRVIDISGDGPNNWGRFVTHARDDAVAAGITINGLPIMAGTASPQGDLLTPSLDLYYQHCVIGGSDAFIEVAYDIKDFAAAVLRKLILEIAGRAPTRRLVSAAARRVPPCDIGARSSLDYMDY